MKKEFKFGSGALKEVLFKCRKVALVIVAVFIFLVIGCVIYYVSISGLPNFLIRESKVEIYSDGQLLEGAMIFKMNRTAKFQKVDNYVLWLPSKTSVGERIILIVDAKNKKVGTTNSSSDDYKLFFNNFLYQSTNAYSFVPFSDCVKSYCFDSGFRIDNGSMFFKIPEFNSYKGHGEINIKFSNNK